MATTKNTKEKTVTETPVAAAPTTPAASKTPKKTLPKLDDSTRVRARSNQYGTLGFTNKRTGDKVFWHDIDEVQDVTVGDIRYMRSNASSFLSEPWIWIEGIEADGCEGLTEEEIYEALGLTRFYKQAQRPKFLSTVYKWNASKIKAEVPTMTRNSKEAIALSLNEAIRDERLTNLPLIKTWEEALGIDLDRE